jgi:hypothetical protein
MDTCFHRPEQDLLGDLARSNASTVKPSLLWASGTAFGPSVGAAVSSMTLYDENAE